MPRPRESERQDIRALVLAKAKQLFVEEGYERTTIRRIASAIGYTPATIYLYFENKDEIWYELHNEGFRLLYRYKMRLTEKGLRDPLERLHEGGRTYVRFALDHPDYYELMFNLPEPRNHIERKRLHGGGAEKGTDEFAMRSLAYLKQSLKDCMDAGYLGGADLDVAAFTFWSVVHGIASLAIRRRTPFPQLPPEELGRDAVDFFMTLVAPAGRRTPS